MIRLFSAVEVKWKRMILGPTHVLCTSWSSLQDLMIFEIAGFLVTSISAMIFTQKAWWGGTRDLDGSGESFRVVSEQERVTWLGQLMSLWTREGGSMPVAEGGQRRGREKGWWGRTGQDWLVMTQHRKWWRLWEDEAEDGRMGSEEKRLGYEMTGVCSWCRGSEGIDSNGAQREKLLRGFRVAIETLKLLCHICIYI